MNRVAIYLRSALKDRSNKIEQQSLQLQKYAADNGGTVVGVYVDNGCSGCRMLRRQSLKEMLRYCREGNIDNVLVLELSNIARKPSQVVDILDKLKQYNVTLTAVYGGGFKYPNCNILSYSTNKIRRCM